MECKECRDCRQTKPLLEFYRDKTKTGGYRHSCIECVLAKNLAYREQHRIELRAQKRIKWAEHKEELKPRKNQLQRQYYQRHKVEINKRQKVYRENNKDKLRAYQQKAKPRRRAYLREYYAKRRDIDSLFVAKERIRARVGGFFRKRGFKKPNDTEKILGCTYDILWEYLLFTWRNKYGQEWSGEPYHIDHVIPLALAKTPRQVEILCHYSNLCMLTPEDNLDKKDKCEWGRYEDIPIGELAYDSPNYINR